MIASKILAVCSQVLPILVHILSLLPFISLRRAGLGIHDTAAHAGYHYDNLEDCS